MEQLALTYSKNGYNFKQIERVKNVAIYEQTEPSNGRFLGYEVFVIRHQKEGVFFSGNKVEEKELTPGNEQWGYLGYTIYSLEKAKEKMAELLKRLDAPHTQKSH